MIIVGLYFILMNLENGTDIRVRFSLSLYLWSESHTRNQKIHKFIQAGILGTIPLVIRVYMHIRDDITIIV